MISGRRPFVFGVVTSVMLATAACTTGPGKQATAPAAASDETTSQPRTATYSCADGGIITVENLGESVRILGAGDEAIELPASPASQRSRYGEQPYALVLEGREALFMKSGEEPLTCIR
jgi:hypothetical protein